MIDSLKKRRVLKDHAASKSFLTVYLSSSCSWSHCIAFQDGHSSQLMTIFFATVPLKDCPTIFTSLPSSPHSVLSSLFSGLQPLSCKTLLYLLALFYLLKHYKAIPTPWPHAPVYALQLLGAGVFLLPCCTGAIPHCSHNIPGFNTLLAVFWRACSWTCPSFRLSFYPILLTCLIGLFTFGVHSFFFYI